jgi:predicted regulator of Ras-like GTPase activity (Roadblock/LC7/MglB family)
MLQPLFPTPSEAAASAPEVESTPAVAGEPAAAADSAQPFIEDNLFILPISVIAAATPEPVQHDIASFNLAASRIEIPIAMIEPGLKSGRIEFSWRELAGWMNPPSKPAQISINGEQRLSLPLGLVAPLFMKSRAGSQARRRTMVDQAIPDLFNANGKPLASAAAVPQEATTAAPVAPPTPAPAAPVPKKVPTNLCELFNEPSKKTWTPNEIVQYSAKLPNVAGTLIALQDGLLVAANMPPDLKTETIAAFVPQIFGRMNQYTTELQMGETSAVSFNVEVGTFQVYNAGIIYFAAFARKGQLLPLPELQLIAGELSRHTK